ncbi:hypothetical protein [Planobispora rosea]|uniref:hypothetical protein n=1 Tax=Planobispora rosea TaxID=35762 RepID=UPI00114CB5E0|nr:hypothetical protein [Planobispora rosea]
MNVVEVTLIAIAAYIALCVLLVGWAMIMAVVGAVMMRLSHDMLVEAPSFLLLRRYGMRRGLPLYICDISRRLRRRSVPEGTVALHAMIASVPVVGFLSGAFLPFLASFLMVPGGDLSGALGEFQDRVLLFTGIPGALVGTWVWWRGVGYMARPWIKRRGRTRRTLLPQALSRRVRNSLVVDSYWLDNTHMAMAFSAAYPFFVAYAFLIPLESPSPQASSPPGQLAGWQFLATLCVILIPAAVAAATEKWISKRWAIAQAGVELLRLLYPVESRKGEEGECLPHLAVEPNASPRAELASICDLLDGAARRIDAQQRRGFAPHPVSTLLRAVSRRIVNHLMGPSYGADLPEDLARVLQLTLVVLTGPADVGPYEKLAALVLAFDSDGAPAAGPLPRSPGLISRMVSRATASVQGLVALVGGLTALMIPLIAVVLIIIGKIDIEKFVGLIK